MKRSVSFPVLKIFLGHVIDANGISQDQHETKAI